MKENENKHIFANTSQNSKSYSLKDLFSSRKKYYILCLTLLVISGTCLGINFSLKNSGKKYSDYSNFFVNDIKSQFNISESSQNDEGIIENDYYVYYYRDTCSACQDISPTIFNYLDKIASFADPIIMYLLNTDNVYSNYQFGSGFSSAEAYKNSLINISSEDEIISFFQKNTIVTPMLFHISNTKIANVYLGTEEITSVLSLNDYSQYQTIDKVTEQLNQTSKHYYIYYYDNLTESRKYKEQILNFVSQNSNSINLYFANAEILGIIDKSIDKDFNKGQTSSVSLRVSSLPYLIEVERKTSVNSYIGFDEISQVLGINNE